MPTGLFDLFLWTGLCLMEGVSCLVLLSFIIEIPLLNANGVDSDQTPLAASDLGLHCFPVSLIWDTRHTYVKSTIGAG